MTLIKAVERLEGAGGAGRGCDVGLVWTRDEKRVTADLEEGEFVASDLRWLEHVEGGPDYVRLVERVTRDAEDLGWVYDVAGRVVGRVAEIDGTLITFCRLAGAGS